MLTSLRRAVAVILPACANLNPPTNVGATSGSRKKAAGAEEQSAALGIVWPCRHPHVLRPAHSTVGAVSLARHRSSSGCTQS
jgi:hypothetical protein